MIERLARSRGADCILIAADLEINNNGCRRSPSKSICRPPFDAGGTVAAPALAP
ncbi:MAG: hypothetical protein KA170_01960 [Candidatus Promineofilum sp.]|nr:hypothetical protein [Promineifilum sp.]